jgi:hypothetical protein
MGLNRDVGRADFQTVLMEMLLPTSRTIPVRSYVSKPAAPTLRL